MKQPKKPLLPLSQRSCVDRTPAMMEWLMLREQLGSIERQAQAAFDKLAQIQCPVRDFPKEELIKLPTSPTRVAVGELFRGWQFVYKRIA